MASIENVQLIDAKATANTVLNCVEVKETLSVYHKNTPVNFVKSYTVSGKGVGITTYSINCNTFTKLESVIDFINEVF